MNTKATAIAVGAAITVLLLSLLVDRLNRWTAKRRVAKLIEDHRNGKLKEVDLEDPKNGVILTDDDRVGINRKGEPPDSVLWERVSEISAYKRDLFSVDLMCVGIKAQHEGREQFLELHEEMKGFKTFMKTLGTRFTFGDPDWWSKVAFPAFETNLTILWKTGDPTTARTVPLTRGGSTSG